MLNNIRFHEVSHPNSSNLIKNIMLFTGETHTDVCINVLDVYIHIYVH